MSPGQLTRGPLRPRRASRPVRELHFVLPGDPSTRSGGFIYDSKIIAALRELGRTVVTHALPDGFPFPGGEAIVQAEHLLAEMSEGTVVVFDGLALGALPALATRYSGQLKLVDLVHHPLADETGLDERSCDRLFGLERAALAQVAGVITTSQHTAASLARYAVSPERIRVVEPGVEPAPLASGSQGEDVVLLCVASLTPRKGHEDLLEALATLRELPWRLICAGSKDRDPACTKSLLRLCDQRGLSDRVTWFGEADEAALQRIYDGADLFVLASRHEGYGMVLTESLMRGLPIVATRAGAIPEALQHGGGRLAPPNDPEAFSKALAPLIAEPTARTALAAEARQARESLPSWPEAGAKFAAALEDLLP